MNEAAIDTPLFNVNTRTDHPAESYRAANSVKKKTVTVAMVTILKILDWHGPMPNHLIVTNVKRYMHASDSGIRSRRSELQAVGLIEKTDLKSLTPDGRGCGVFKISESGTRALKLIDAKPEDEKWSFQELLETIEIDVAFDGTPEEVSSWRLLMNMVKRSAAKKRLR